MAKTSAFLTFFMIFFYMRPMQIPFPSLKKLAADCYVKKVDLQFMGSKGHVYLYKKQCEAIQAEIVNLPYKDGFELGAQFLYTTKNSPKDFMKSLAQQLRMKAYTIQEPMYERLFIHLYNFGFIPSPVPIKFPLIDNKFLLVDALKQKDLRLIERLLHYGANPNSTLSVDSFVSYAVKHNLYKVVELLVKYGANVNPKYGTHPLYYAALAGNERMVNFLVQNGSLIHSRYMAHADSSIFQRLTILMESAPGVVLRDQYANAIQLLNQIIID